MPTDNISKAAYWDGIYRDEESPGWDLGHPAPPLAHALKSGRIRPGRVAVLGCGFGHDARLLAEQGFIVNAFDISARAVRRAQSRHKGVKGLKFHRADLFKLSRFAGRFDYVYEYTCFCAIDPARRLEFAQVVHRLLKPRGMLFGCFYNHGRKGGPPFDVTKAEVRRTFSPLFEIRKLAVSRHSIERRKGAELWAEFIARPQ